MKKTITLGLNYNEFEKGIKACDKQMKVLDSEFKASSKEMEKNGDSAGQMQAKIDSLTKKIDLQAQKTEIAKQKLDALKNSHTASETAINNATIAYNKERESLASLEIELENTSNAHGNFGAAAMAMVATLMTVGNAIKSVTTGAAQYADDILTMSAQTGIAVDTLQGWVYAAPLVDTSIEQMIAGFSKLEQAMNKNSSAFNELGVSITNSDGSMRDAEQVYMETIDALGQVENATRQDQLAMEIFGKSAREMTGMIEAGSEGLQAYSQAAKEAGAPTEEDIKLLGNMQNSFDELRAKTEYAKDAIAVQFAPAIIALTEAIKKIPTPVLAAGMSIASIATAIGGVIAVATTLKGLFPALAAAAIQMGSSIAASAPQVLLIAAAITAVSLAIYEAIKLYREWKEAQKQLNDTYPKTFMGSQHGGGGYSRNASGTDYFEGGKTWVGENGPEIVELPQGTRIYNNNESKQIAGNTTYNINMSLDLSKMKSVSDVVEAVQGLQMSSTLGGRI